MRDDRERLLDILEAIERVETYGTRGRKAFEQDELVQVWIVHHLQIIGEAARKLTEALRSRHPEISWAQIIAMRHILVHDYFRVDEEEVWVAVERDLPHLKSKIQAILQEWGTGLK